MVYIIDMKKVYWRNIISLGGYTKVVSIPRELLKGRKIKKGSEAIVKITGSNSFLVELPKR